MLVPNVHIVIINLILQKKLFFTIYAYMHECLLQLTSGWSHCHFTRVSRLRSCLKLAGVVVFVTVTTFSQCFSPYWFMSGCWLSLGGICIDDANMSANTPCKLPAILWHPKQPQGAFCCSAIYLLATSFTATTPQLVGEYTFSLANWGFQGVPGLLPYCAPTLVKSCDNSTINRWNLLVKHTTPTTHLFLPGLQITFINCGVDL